MDTGSLVNVSAGLVSKFLEYFDKRDIPQLERLSTELKIIAGQSVPDPTDAAALVMPLSIATDLDLLSPEVLQCFLLQFPVESHRRLYAEDLLHVRLG